MPKRGTTPWEERRKYLDPEWREANGLTREDVAGMVDFDLDDYEDWARESGDFDVPPREPKRRD